MTGDDSFTLVLSKGVHLISASDARAIRSAIENDEAIVEVRLDPLGNVDRRRATWVAVRHVVAIAANDGDESSRDLPPNVAAFAARARVKPESGARRRPVR